ncbi:hypothetical protein AK830_g8289 [Neonectria ditissima]|uniref:Uncharacterized protein n=1 Tax=Neonectria ditissima TaxID=78410 RepID=A0A0P7BBS0_9HYPO|nr:hypothetical protein AK830_g8289 [Neonectria ditissima]
MEAPAQGQGPADRPIACLVRIAEHNQPQVRNGRFLFRCSTPQERDSTTAARAVLAQLPRESCPLAHPRDYFLTPRSLGLSASLCSTIDVALLPPASP